MATTIMKLYNSSGKRIGLWFKHPNMSYYFLLNCDPNHLVAPLYDCIQSLYKAIGADNNLIPDWDIHCLASIHVLRLVLHRVHRTTSLIIVVAQASIRQLRLLDISIFVIVLTISFKFLQSFILHWYFNLFHTFINHLYSWFFFFSYFNCYILTCFTIGIYNKFVEAVLKVVSGLCTRNGFEQGITQVCTWEQHTTCVLQVLISVYCNSVVYNHSNNYMLSTSHSLTSINVLQGPLINEATLDKVESIL